MAEKPKAIVLGGYGLIGSACLRRLSQAGFAVSGVGRSQRAAQACAPETPWIIRDIPTITVPEWRQILRDVDVVVNASGALQDGAQDDLDAIHVRTLSRLIAAAEGLPLRIVQISAAGVSHEASTAFMRSKAQGDALLSDSGVDHVILRPTLVLSQEAYGGTALLRAAAALPIVAPQILPKAQVQTVSVEDVAEAVRTAAQHEVPSRLIADLTAPEIMLFPDLVAAIRKWQGWPAPRFRPALPSAVLGICGRIADGLGHLGWRSPFRTTALIALKEGIRGDPAPWIKAGGRPMRPLSETLARMPATRQERLFARAYLALPLAIAVLSLFWCLSGLIALCDPARAIAVLTTRAVPGWLAAVAVLGGAVADIGLGLAILWRRWTKPATLGMLGLSTAYLIGSLLFAADLWVDPLGPMLKVLPAMMLAAMLWLLLEDK